MNRLKKRSVPILLILSMMLLTVTSLSKTTLAWFTAVGGRHNSIALASVEGEVTEEVSGLEKSDIAVLNTGTVPVYVRIKAAFPTGILEEGELILEGPNQQFELGDDGYYYYGKTLNPGEESVPLFTKISYSDVVVQKLKLGILTKDQLQIPIYAEMIQADHMDITTEGARAAMEAFGKLKQ